MYEECMPATNASRLAASWYCAVKTPLKLQSVLRTFCLWKEFFQWLTDNLSTSAQFVTSMHFIYVFDTGIIQLAYGIIVSHALVDTRIHQCMHRFTCTANLSASVMLVILSVYETNVSFQCFHFLQLSTAFAAVSNTCGFKQVSTKIGLFLLSIIICAKRNHQQPLVGFIKLRNPIHSEKYNETESVHQHTFKATHE